MSNERNLCNSQGNLELVIKAQFGDDIRRIRTFPYISLNELVLMVQRVFQEKLPTDNKLLLKYYDEDGDLVTIRDSADLKDAVKNRQNQSPKIFVVVDECAINLQSTQHSEQQQLGCAIDTMDPNSAVGDGRGRASSKLLGNKYHPYSTLIGKGHGSSQGNPQQKHAQIAPTELSSSSPSDNPKQKKQSPTAQYQKQKQPKQVPGIGLRNNLPDKIVRSNSGAEYECQICKKPDGSRVSICGMRNVKEHVGSKRHQRNLNKC